MGIATSIRTPPATRPTMMDVTVLEDWTKAVASMSRQYAEN